MLGFRFKKNKKKTRIDIVKEVFALCFMFIFLSFSVFLWVHGIKNANSEQVGYFDKISSLAEEIKSNAEKLRE